MYGTLEKPSFNIHAISSALVCPLLSDLTCCVLFRVSVSVSVCLSVFTLTVAFACMHLPITLCGGSNSQRRERLVKEKGSEGKVCHTLTNSPIQTHIHTHTHTEREKEREEKEKAYKFPAWSLPNVLCDGVFVPHRSRCRRCSGSESSVSLEVVQDPLPPHQSKNSSNSKRRKSW